MGKQIKIRGANVRGLQIYRRIEEIKRQAIKEQEFKIGGLFDELKENNELDQDTLKVLQILLNKGNKVDTVEERITQIVESFKNEIRANKEDGAKTILLNLSTDGDLYRQPKTKYCYPMKKSGLRLNIIRFLVDKKNYVPGKEIAREIQTDPGTTGFSINKINSISKRLLSLPEKEKLIVSKSRGGYKINPLYPITQE